MKYFIVDDQTLMQVNALMMEMPFKFAHPLNLLLDKGVRPYEPPKQDDVPPPVQSRSPRRRTTTA